MALFWARKHEFWGMIKVTILSQIHASWHLNVSNSWVSIYSLNQGNVKISIWCDRTDARPGAYDREKLRVK